MSDDEPSYNNSHRAFLQTFLARSTFTLREAKPVLASILSVHEDRETPTEDITEADFNSYVSVLNATISPYDLEIRSTYRQAPPFSSRSSSGNEGASSRSRIYALVNTTSDPLSRLATVHSAEEMEYVQRLLDDMFEKYNTPTREIMALTDLQAMNARKGRGARNSDVTANGDAQEAQMKPMPGAQAEKLLESLVAEGWFDKFKDYYTLSPRALMELRGWLIETYNEPPDEEERDGVERIKLCQACREIVTMGQRCQNRNCKARLHDHCTGNLFRTQRGEQKCPLCRADWTGRDFVGPKAATTSNRDRNSATTNGENGVRMSTFDTTRRRSRNSVDGAGVNDDEEEEDEC